MDFIHPTNVMTGMVPETIKEATKETNHGGPETSKDTGSVRLRNQKDGGVQRKGGSEKSDQ